MLFDELDDCDDRLGCLGGGLGGCPDGPGGCPDGPGGGPDGPGGGPVCGLGGLGCPGGPGGGPPLSVPPELKSNSLNNELTSSWLATLRQFGLP